MFEIIYDLMMFAVIRFSQNNGGVMEKIAEGLIGWIFVFLGLIAAIGGVIMKLADMGTAHTGGGDLATWLGAIFAGLAFGGTIVLAWQRNYADRQAAFRRAYVVAASNTMQLVRFRLALERASVMLTFQKIDDEMTTFMSREEAHSYIHRVENIKISSDDLGALSVLEGNDAFRLALAMSLLENLKADLLDNMIDDKRDRIFFEYESDAYTERLDRISKLARVVAENFSEITRAQAPHPNDDELWRDYPRLTDPETNGAHT